MESNSLVDKALNISRHFIALVENYRYLLACYQETCDCHVNFDHNLFFRQLEEKYGRLNQLVEANGDISKLLLTPDDEVEELDLQPPPKKTLYIKRVHITERPKRPRLDIEERSEEANGESSKFETAKSIEYAYRCNYQGCDHLCFTPANLETHMKIHEGVLTNEIPISKDVVTYVCEICTKEFPGQKFLQTHMDNAHSSAKEFACDIANCTYRTRFRCVLEDHKRRHLKIKEFKCTWENCKAEFVTKRDLNAHINFSHKGIKNYYCQWPNCDASFKDSNRLRHHFFIHTGERPYTCDFEGCEASFKQLPHLQKHRKTHETNPENARQSPRLLKCTEENCFSKFREESDLDAHLSESHGMLVTKCIDKNCSRKVYRSAEEYKQHINEAHKMTYGV